MESNYLNSQVDRIAKNIDDASIYLKRMHMQMVEMLDNVSKINAKLEAMTKNYNEEKKNENH